MEGRRKESESAEDNVRICFPPLKLLLLLLPTKRSKAVGFSFLYNIQRHYRSVEMVLTLNNSSSDLSLGLQHVSLLSRSAPQ